MAIHSGRPLCKAYVLAKLETSCISQRKALFWQFSSLEELQISPPCFSPKLPEFPASLLLGTVVDYWTARFEFFTNNIPGWKKKSIDKDTFKRFTLNEFKRFLFNHWKIFYNIKPNLLQELFPLLIDASTSWKPVWLSIQVNQIISNSWILIWGKLAFMRTYTFL